MTSDLARSIAFDPRAPQDERTDALAELQKGAVPTAMLSDEVMAQIFQFADPLNKAISKNVVPFPGKNQGKPGMQSVMLDEVTISLQGDWFEKRSNLGFHAMRQMVDQTPVLNAVVMTRIRQVSRFCRVQESGEGLGFTVRHIDKDHQITQTERESVALLNRFVTNCGWEFNPRNRKRLRRDSFTQFMGKLVRDSLTMDSAPIETEFKRDRKKGIDGLYAVDGATIRLCTEDGYRGDDEIFALQVIDGQIRSAYTHDDLIYEPRNPLSDVLSAGYGMGEPELLVRVVTGFLNAMTYNIKGFDSNSIPKGVLHLSGDYSQDDLTAFKRYWNSMVRGVNNAWSLPVMISKDQESKASFENFGVEFNEMYFAKWMTFLTSVICAIYGMSPSEINFDSFTGGSTSALSGSDTEEKLADSKDKGLRPLLSYFENVLTDFVVCDFSEDFVFRWTGLDEQDAQQREERAKLVLTVNEIRAQDGYDAMDGPLGDAPVNPSLIGPWMQMQQSAQGPDVGNPDDPNGGGKGGNDEQDQDTPDDGSGDGQSGDGGEDNDPGQVAGAQGDEEDGGGSAQDRGRGRPEGFRKALDGAALCCATDDAASWPNGDGLLKAAQLGISHGDELFFQHKDRGVLSGRVVSTGADGCMLESGEGEKAERHPVLWDSVLGHKTRKERKYIPVEHGEDGMIAEDAETGRRVYLHGELPPGEDDDEEPGDVIAKALS